MAFLHFCKNWQVIQTQKINVANVPKTGVQMIKQVILSKKACKQIKRIPFYIVRSLLRWVEDIEEIGLEETRKKSGYHDELLKGDRSGQRSVRLNIAYRAIYKIQGEKLKFVSVEEVSKHDY